MKNKVFIIIDGNSVVHRAFHALPMLTGKDGNPSGAVYGFVLALFRAIEDFHPDYIAACFDTKAPTFRHDQFKDYKAQRPQTPKDLIPQFGKIVKLLQDFNIAVFSEDGFEADDLIASIVFAAKKDPRSESTDFFILTGDYDSLQLVDRRVKAYIINRGIKNAVLYDETKVKESFGVTAKQIPALKALAGDASDNIPGAPGIGPKGAVEILNNFSSLEELYRAADADPETFLSFKGDGGEKMKNILLENKEKILNFQKLTTMRNDATVGGVFNKCEFANFAGSRSGESLLDLGFSSLAKRLPKPATGRNGTLF